MSPASSGCAVIHSGNLWSATDGDVPPPMGVGPAGCSALPRRRRADAPADRIIRGHLALDPLAATPDSRSHRPRGASGDSCDAPRRPCRAARVLARRGLVRAMDDPGDRRVLRADGPGRSRFAARHRTNVRNHRSVCRRATRPPARGVHKSRSDRRRVGRVARAVRYRSGLAAIRGDQVSADWAEKVARELAATQEVAATRTSTIPTQCQFSEVAGLEEISSAAVLRRWKHPRDQ